MPYVVPGYWVPGYAVGDDEGSLSSIVVSGLVPMVTVGPYLVHYVFVVPVENRTLSVVGEVRIRGVGSENRVRIVPNND